MKFSFALFKKLKPAGIKALLTDANIICAGVLSLAVFFVVLIAIDAYLFYAVRNRESEAVPSPAPTAALAAREIDDAIKLVDQRAKEYEALLNAK